MGLFPPVHNSLRTHLSVWVVYLCFVPFLASAQSSMDKEGALRTGTWSLDVFTHHIHGAFCLFEEDEGAVRIEAFAGLKQKEFTTLPAMALDNLLWRQTDGWTVILSADGTGLINPWHEGWEIIEPTLVIYLRTMLASLDYYSSEDNLGWPAGIKVLTIPVLSRSRCPEPRFTQPGQVSVRLELPLAGAKPSFRQKMVTSGRGRGLDAEIVILSTEMNSSGNELANHSLVLRSSRRPGAFRLCETEKTTVHYAGQDPFIPMWPLGDLLRLE